jgi:hypothetical protein
MTCAGAGLIAGIDFVSCQSKAERLRAVIFEGWAIEVPLCVAHAELWDDTATKRPTRLGLVKARSVIRET